MLKIAFLIDTSTCWDEDPSWQLFSEEDAVRRHSYKMGTKYCKRIVYAEVPDEEK